MEDRMTPDDRRAIDGLFQRLEDVEQRATEPRDRDAEALIARRLAERPAAAYYLAQTVVVQQQALEQAERRIAELEEQGEARQGWGRPARYDQRQQQQYADDRNNPGPWNRSPAFGGGGFLAGAAQTAMGVAGGVLLGNLIGGLFGGGEAHAAETPQQDANQADNNSADSEADNSGDAGSDAGGFDAGGFDGGGDFDMGGDF
jgi:hypothetical protein